MPRKYRLSKRRRHRFGELARADREVLQTGHAFFPQRFQHAGSRLNQLEDTAEIRDAWAEFRDDLIAERIGDMPGTRPFWWWKFDASEPREADEPEREYLDRLGLLTDDERAALKVHDYTEHDTNARWSKLVVDGWHPHVRRTADDPPARERTDLVLRDRYEYGWEYIANIAKPCTTFPAEIILNESESEHEAE